MYKLLKERETTGKCPGMRTLTQEQNINKMVENLQTQALARSGVLRIPKNKIVNYK